MKLPVHRVVVGIFIVVLGGLSSSVEAVEVSDLRSGLACMYSSSGEGGRGWICQQTERVLITDQGQCKSNGRLLRCTWVGVEFNYRRARLGEKLECRMTRSLISNSDVAEPVSSEIYSLELPSSEGRFFNPQYFVYAVLPAGQNVVRVVNKCKSGGADLFEYQLELNFPEDDGMAPGERGPTSMREIALWRNSVVHLKARAQ